MDLDVLIFLEFVGALISCAKLRPSRFSGALVPACKVGNIYQYIVLFCHYYFGFYRPRSTETSDGHAALSDHGSHPPYTLHGCYDLTDRESKFACLTIPGSTEHDKRWKEVHRAKQLVVPPELFWFFSSMNERLVTGKQLVVPPDILFIF